MTLLDQFFDAINLGTARLSATWPTSARLSEEILKRKYTIINPAK